jgi:hypothetical protein
MWIVAYALRHPISIAAMAALMMLLGVVAFFAMPKDIFPGVDIREVNVVWYYPGMSADLRFEGGEGLPFREGAAVSNDHRALHQRAVREPIGTLHGGLLFDIVASNATVARPVRL